MRYGYRLCSDKNYGLWLNEDCTFSILWIVPILNTIAAITLLCWIALNAINIRFKGSKFLNTDLNN